MKRFIITVTLFFILVGSVFAAPKVVSQKLFKDGGFYVEYDCEGTIVSVSDGTAQELIADAVKRCYIYFDSSDYLSNEDAALLIDQFGYIMCSDWDEEEQAVCLLVVYKEDNSYKFASWYIK